MQTIAAALRGLRSAGRRRSGGVSGAASAGFLPRSCQILDWEAGHSKSVRRGDGNCQSGCSYCYKYGDIAEEPFSLCGGCDERRYCSTSCAYADWHFGRGDGAHHLTCPGAKAAERLAGETRWRNGGSATSDLSRFRCGVVNGNIALGTDAAARAERRSTPPLRRRNALARGLVPRVRLPQKSDGVEARPVRRQGLVAPRAEPRAVGEETSHQEASQALQPPALS